MTAHAQCTLCSMLLQRAMKTIWNFQHVVNKDNPQSKKIWVESQNLIFHSQKPTSTLLQNIDQLILNLKLIALTQWKTSIVQGSHP